MQVIPFHSVNVTGTVCQTNTIISEELCVPHPRPHTMIRNKNRSKRGATQIPNIANTSTSLNSERYFCLVQMKSSNNPSIILRLIVKIQDVTDECTHVFSNSYHRK